ncbi:MAG TPA: hypothetical protein DF383_11505 [Deltaproteobacteria bacterium]|nr:hypothetical protein [Deltaproteobacteria bacterium]
MVRCAGGKVCSNLRELLEAARSVPDAVLEHHMMRCALEDYFELYEFPNDFARWCWNSLGDQALGEQLGLIDPYQQSSLVELRATLVNLIEDRLWHLQQVPWCRKGMELHLLESRLVVYDTGERIDTVASLAEALERMSLRSIYYHVHEAHRRSGHSDDFSLWLETLGTSRALVEKIRSIDFYFLNLGQLREEILQALRQYLAAPAVLQREAVP